MRSAVGGVAKEALEGFTGLYLSDRYAGYAFLALRAFCLEHLRRDALKACGADPAAPRPYR